MRIIISPAKKMNVDTDSFPIGGLPLFLPQAEHVLAALQAMSPQELQKLWKCNDNIAKQNVERLKAMDLRHNLTPAILSYQGLQYRYMAPGVMDARQLDYLQGHLRIVSGFYGLLRPFDGVTPYRLEMQAKLSVDEEKDLYSFWGQRLAKRLMEESGFVLDLASQEYSRGVAPYLPKTQILTCVFGQWSNGKVREKGALCKMARGQMARWMAENEIENPKDIRAFSQLNYRFCPELSSKNQYVFLQPDS